MTAFFLKGSCARMVGSGNVSSGGATTDALIEHRREIADLLQRIKNRRLQVFGLYGTPVALVVTLLVWAGLKVFIWLNADTPTAINGIFAAAALLLGAAAVVQAIAEFGDSSPWTDSETSVRELKLDLALAEERHILEARRRTPPAMDRQASYKERIPGEIARLRGESRHYRRLHLLMQWLLFFSSAAISAVTAWYDPPQPAKGVLIGLGFTVTVITAAAGYFKPRERSFNLQQTADSIEQHTTALELGIAPYGAANEDENLGLFAATVEGIRAEQRMREQQLDQPQQGQQQVI
ncbi:SLATT domain-containing protein [Streptomyces sp. NPDC007940]|uniref:SLATT domain-containing protein n=1 Tax=Streptomyces sp. NPDC007940 TaxID=3364796 RepID=UPI0036E59F24